MCEVQEEVFLESRYIPSSFEYDVFLGQSEVNYEDPNLVLLDTCAQVSIFHNKDLLSNIQAVSHINHWTLKKQFQHSTNPFGNILCFTADVAHSYSTTIVDGNFLSSHLLVKFLSPPPTMSLPNSSPRLLKCPLPRLPPLQHPLPLSQNLK
jgi:hypothetical protein